MSVSTLDKRNSYTIQILFKIKKGRSLIPHKILYQSNLSCECVSLYINQYTLTPVTTGSASASASLCKCKSSYSKSIPKFNLQISRLLSFLFLSLSLIL